MINLDDIWEWLGFSQKYHAKYLLVKQFIVDEDYKILLPKVLYQTTEHNNSLYHEVKQKIIVDDDEIIQNPKKELKLSRGGHNK